MGTFKKAMMFPLMIIFVVALSGCGVSKEEHEKVVSELNKAKSDLAQAKAKISEREKPTGKAMDQVKSATNAPEMLQSKLAATQKEATDLRAKVESLEGENSRLNELLGRMKGQFDELQKKFGALQSPSTSLPGKDLPTKEMPTDILKKKF